MLLIFEVEVTEVCLEARKLAKNDNDEFEKKGAVTFDVTEMKESDFMLIVASDFAPA